MQPSGGERDSYFTILVIIRGTDLPAALGILRGFGQN
jgi:hypothetical protein